LVDFLYEILWFAIKANFKIFHDDFHDEIFRILSFLFVIFNKKIKRFSFFSTRKSQNFYFCSKSHPRVLYILAYPGYAIFTALLVRINPVLDLANELYFHVLMVKFTSILKFREKSRYIYKNITYLIFILFKHFCFIYFCRFSNILFLLFWTNFSFVFFHLFLFW